MFTSRLSLALGIARHLPDDLRALVRESVALLGHIAADEAGQDAFAWIEIVRKEAKASRHDGEAQQAKRFALLLEKLRRSSPEKRYEIGHSFALMLELMNTCENAYRTWRLRKRARADQTFAPENLIFVLTAHPTEARSSDCVEAFHKVQELLTLALDTQFDHVREDLKTWLRIAWKLPMANQTKPQVRDEAEYIYSNALRFDNLKALLGRHRAGQRVYLQTWVGGDKDGHPGVDAQTFRQSLETSRSYILKYICALLGDAAVQTKLLKKNASLERSFISLRNELSKYRVIRPGDARHIDRLKKRLMKFRIRVEKIVEHPLSPLDDMMRMFELFPALVVPIEFRESAEMFRTAASRKTIRQMLQALASISKGGLPKQYVRALVISMVESVNDLTIPMREIHQTLKGMNIRLVPLFETEKALTTSVDILNEFISNRTMKKAIEKNWNHSLEVMLGYSDSSKAFGALPSRRLIARAMHRIERMLEKQEIRPIFFHGTGGSVARGGGSVAEQTAWWAKSARKNMKMTIQGEMVQRTFSSPEILNRQIDSLTLPAKTKKPSRHPSVRMFSGRIRDTYVNQIGDGKFLDVVHKATPYSFLDHLRIGSRPTKRKGKASALRLRAIPWVMCWTQTRTLFPTWWGVGTAWKACSKRDKKELKKQFEEDMLFRSFVKLLGFTLRKVELGIWTLYLNQSTLSKTSKTNTVRMFHDEYTNAVDFVRAMSGQKSLVWFRPWLDSSIELRSSMIHPLNVLQLIAIETSGYRLLRETVTGISSGMLTTG